MGNEQKDIFETKNLERSTIISEVEKICANESLATSVVCVVLSRYLQRQVTIYEVMYLKSSLIEEVKNPLNTPTEDNMNSYLSKTNGRAFSSIIRNVSIDNKKKILRLLDEKCKQKSKESNDLFLSLMQEAVEPESELEQLIGEQNIEAVLNIMNIKLFKGTL